MYNDSILYEIISRFDKEDAIVVYFPDHGEEVFDKCTTFGRPHIYKPIDLYQQFQIPFWVYVTNKYKESHPFIVEKLKEVKDYPIMTDVVPHFLINLAGISSSAYNPKYDFMNEQYDLKRKRMIMGTIDYDQVMKNFVE